VEYFLKQELDKINMAAEKEWIHFGLTSQDVNNTAIPLSWKDCLENEYLPAVINLQKKLKSFADKWKNVSMLAHTHGQPASPTKLGKVVIENGRKIGECPRCGCVHEVLRRQIREQRR